MSGHILLSSQEVEVRLLPCMAKSSGGETLIVATDLCGQEWKFALTAFRAAGRSAGCLLLGGSLWKLPHVLPPRLPRRFLPAARCCCAGETRYAISGALPFLRAHRASPGDVFSLYQLQARLQQTIGPAVCAVVLLLKATVAAL